MHSLELLGPLGRCWRRHPLLPHARAELSVCSILFSPATLYESSGTNSHSYSCVARRRRKRGRQPFYGTGWMAPNGGKFGHHQQAGAYNTGAGYNQGYNQGGHQMYNYNQGAAPQGTYNQPYNSPPAYGGQQQQDSYYGGQQYGVQTPPATYQHNSYAPPPGPPPGK